MSAADVSKALWATLAAQQGYKCGRVCRADGELRAVSVTGDGLLLCSTEDPPGAPQRRVKYDEMAAVAVDTAADGTPEITITLKPPATGSIVLLMEPSPLNLTPSTQPEIFGNFLPALRESVTSKGCDVEWKGVPGGGAPEAAAGAGGWKPPPPPGAPPGQQGATPPAAGEAGAPVGTPNATAAAAAAAVVGVGPPNTAGGGGAAAATGPLNHLPPPAKRPEVRTTNPHIDVTVGSANCRYARVCHKVNNRFGAAERVFCVMRDYLIMLGGENTNVGVKKFNPVAKADAGTVRRFIPFDKIEKITTGRGSKDGAPQVLITTAPPDPDTLLVMCDTPMNPTPSTEEEIIKGLIPAIQECCAYHGIPLNVEITEDDLREKKAAKLGKDKSYIPPQDLLLRDPNCLKPEYAKRTQARVAAAAGVPGAAAALQPAPGSGGGLSLSPKGAGAAGSPLRFASPGGPARPGIAADASPTASPLARGIFDPASPASQYAAAGVYSPVLSPYVLREKPQPPPGAPPQHILDRVGRSKAAKNAAAGGSGGAARGAGGSPLTPGGSPATSGRKKGPPAQGLPENTAVVHADAIGKLESYIDQLKTETQIAELQMQAQKGELREIAEAAKQWQNLVARQQDAAAEQQRRFNEHIRAVQDQYEAYCEAAYEQNQRAAEQRLAYQATMHERNEAQWASVLDALVPCQEDLGDDTTATASDVSDGTLDDAPPHRHPAHGERVTIKAETSRGVFSLPVGERFWTQLRADAGVVDGSRAPPLCHVTRGGEVPLALGERYLAYFGLKWCERERYCVSMYQPATGDWTFHDGRHFWTHEFGMGLAGGPDADEDLTPPPPLSLGAPAAEAAVNDTVPPPLDYVLNASPPRAQHPHLSYGLML